MNREQLMTVLHRPARHGEDLACDAEPQSVHVPRAPRRHQDRHEEGRAADVRREGARRADRERAGQDAPLRRALGSHAGLEEGVREPRRGPDDRLRSRKARPTRTSSHGLSNTSQLPPARARSSRSTARTCTRAARTRRSPSAQSKTGARNHFGRITTRHHGGGSRQKYRIIDFKRDKDGIAGVVERVEYDPNRTAHIALIRYADGERRYIIAPKGVAARRSRSARARDAPIKAGNAMPLRHIPVGSTRAQRRDEARQGRRSSRAAPAAPCSTPRAKASTPTLRLKSGETRRVHVDCRATIGEVGNDEHNLRKLRQGRREALARHPSDGARPGDESGRPSARRRRGQVRPGQSASGVARGARTTKGLKTRHNKRTDHMIVQRRRNKVR